MRPDPRFSKEAVERRIFDVLAPLIGWTVLDKSVQQLKPPRPDILCEVAGTGPMAVELVALDVPQTRQRLTNMFGTADAWRVALARRPVGEQQALQARLHDAHISVIFAEQAGLRDRAAALGKLQGFLLGHPGRRGEVGAADIGHPDGFHSSTIWRGAVSDGPHITSPSAGYWHPPQVGAITKHLQTYYDTDATLDLFAYATHDEPDGSVGSLATIQAAVAQYLPGSQFRQVHLFHVGFRQHIWSSD